MLLQWRKTSIRKNKSFVKWSWHLSWNHGSILIFKWNGIYWEQELSKNPIYWSSWLWNSTYLFWFKTKPGKLTWYMRFDYKWIHPLLTVYQYLCCLSWAIKSFNGIRLFFKIDWDVWNYLRSWNWSNWKW